MKTKRKVSNFNSNSFFFQLCFLILTFFLSINIVNAGSASFSFNGQSSTYIGQNIEVTLSIGNIVEANGGVVAVQGILNYDNAYLEYVSSQNLAPFAVSYATGSKKLAGIDLMKSSPIFGSSNLIKIVFKTKQVGSTTISLSGVEVSDAGGSILSASGTSKTITINNPPSTNNNLASLSVSSGTLNFNKATTSYSVAVDSTVASINIAATAEDSGASISGAGTKSLNYGDNKFNIVVTAPSGDKKTYTITVNRKDIRSTNNKLSSLSVSGYELNPKFNANTTNYTLEVPFSVDSVSVKATAADSKAKVAITGQNNLVAEETRNVNIKVTAENGSVRTYVIKVTRGKDPNKVLSQDNSLVSLTTEAGNLEPLFDKDVTNYTLNVPFDIKEVTFNAVVSDTKYATVSVDKPDTLSVGKNRYSFTVTAEDNSTKTYTVIVIRATDPNYISTNTFLKDIKVSNGEIKEKFDKNINVYTYTKKDKFEIDAIPEDESSKVVIHEHDDIYTIFVEAGSGDTNVYILKPVTSNRNLIIVIISAIVLSVGGVIAGYYIGLKRKVKKVTKDIKKSKPELKQTT